MLNIVKKDNVCLLCGSSANIIYNNLKDDLFSVPGLWGIVRCKSKKCGLAWLIPEPDKDKIKEFYKSYYTHDVVRNKKIEFRNSFEKILYRIIKIVYSLVRRLLFINRERENLEYMLLKKFKGRVLEIGCGNGERLYKLKKYGFLAEGVEIDEKAANIAEKKYDLKIYRGDIRELNIPSDSFDFIIMNHVLEHISEPISFLKECKRIIKRGGKIILTTPNFDSYSHKYFKQYWRGLEPPRHLYLYTLGSLDILCKKAGLNKSKIWTSTAKTEFIIGDSIRLEKKIKGIYNLFFSDIIKIWYLQVKIRLLNFFKKDAGDECVLIAEKV